MKGALMLNTVIAILPILALFGVIFGGALGFVWWRNKQASKRTDEDFGVQGITGDGIGAAWWQPPPGSETPAPPWLAEGFVPPATSASGYPTTPTPPPWQRKENQ